VDEAERQFKATQADVSVAQSSVRVAEQKLELAKEGSRQEEIRIAEGQLKAAERALEVATSDLGKQQVAADEVNAAQAAYEQAEAAILSGEAAVRSAKAGLIQSKMSEDDVRNAEAAITQAQADIQFYQTQRADLTVRAPVSGVVSTRQVNVGEMVTNTSPLMTLVALNEVYLEASVPELEVSQVKPGALADITIDALAGKKFKGTVSQIILVADRASRAYRVRTTVLAGKSQLPVGGFARATIHVGTRTGTLAVSKDAIHSEAGDKFVWLIGKAEKKAAPEGEHGEKHEEGAQAEAPAPEGFVAKRQLVTVGLVDDRFAEILAGLKPGDQVIAAGSPAIIEGTPVKVSGQ
jgi:multidrug efflux pump subunit AcrA (membrane-fusion protein)